jgi:two-component system, NarL family, response regulator DegU
MENMQTESRMIRVVLLDDHQVVRAGIRSFLEGSRRIKVVAEGADGSLAQSLVEEHQPDVVVMDIQMPGMSGIEATRRLRQGGSAVKILILTAYDDKPYIQALFKAGVNGYMLKTAEPFEIIQAIEDVSLGRQKLDQNLTDEGGSQAMSTGIVNKDLFSEREMEVLRLVAEGMTNKEIAHTLDISSRTVQNHLANMFKKAGSASRTELITLASRINLLQPEFDQHKPQV